MNLYEIRKIVGKIKTQLFKNSNSFSIGMLKSHFRGSGLQFREHQQYVYGDEVRFIDWKILAKTGTPHIKTFDEERNVEIVTVVDAGGSMLSGVNGISKLLASIEITSLLYLLSKETGDKVHCIVLSDKVIHLPPMSGDRGIATFVSVLQKNNVLTEDGSVNLNNRISDYDITERNSILLKHLKRKHEIVLLSDFYNFLDYSMLKKIINKSNVHAFRLLTPLDEADSVPYLLPISNSGIKAGISMYRVKLSGQKKIENLLSNKIRNIRVHNHYLEEFIKEMV